MKEEAQPSSWSSIVPRRDLPVFIICRDLVSDLRKLVVWFEEAGHENITFLDNASTYPPLLDYLERTHYRVVRLEENMGHRVPWLCGALDALANRMPFVVTDPDLLPDPEAPPDSFEYMQELLLRYPDFDKIDSVCILTTCRTVTLTEIK